MDISQRLIEVRARLDWPPKEAAKKIGISQQFLGQIERGEKRPSLKTLGKIAAAYGVPVESLVDNSVEMPPVPRSIAPRGSRRMRKYLEGLSDRGRATLLSVADSIYKVDQDYESIQAKANLLGSRLGGEFLDVLIAELQQLAAELGSWDAATDELIRRIRGKNPGNDQ